MTLHTELEQAVAQVERCLGNLRQALCAHDAPAIELHARELQRALAAALDRQARSARGGDAARQLRQRLAVAAGQVAAQRESLARASAALDRAIDVLLPAAHPGVAYTAAGRADRGARSGLLQA